MGRLVHIVSPYRFFGELNESVKSAREFFVSRKKQEYLPQYKEKLIADLRAKEDEASQAEISQEIERIQSGEMDREIRSMLMADKEIDSEILRDEAFVRLMDKVKENTTFGPNVLALPIAKMYLKYSSREDVANLLNLIDSLQDNELKDYLRGRNIDINSLFREYLEGPSSDLPDATPAYELFSDRIRDIKGESKANWLVQELKTDAAMGPNRDRPPFNQVEAYRRLSDRDPLKLRFIQVAREFEKNKNIPSVAEAIKIVKKKIAGYGSLTDLISFVDNMLNSALNSSDDMQDFLKQARVLGPLVDVVYQDESRIVVIAHHEIALANLFSMAAWCILPRGWGGGRNMWNNYIGPSHKAIQFAVMDFSKPASNNMRCWAFTYNVPLNRITNAHAKDDATIIQNFNQTGLEDIFTKKESITGRTPYGELTTYDDSETFTIPDYTKNEINENIEMFFEKTKKYDASFKLRSSSGTEITDFTKSDIYSPGGVMRNFIEYGAVRAKAIATGASPTSFVEKNKDTLDMLLGYLSADPLSEKYRENKAKGAQTLSDTFISPFLKPIEKMPSAFPINNAELANYMLAVLKSTKTFNTETIKSFIKTSTTFLKLLNNTYSLRKNEAVAKIFRYQIEETISALAVLLKSIDIQEIPVGEVNKPVKDVKLDEIKELITFIESTTK